MIWRRVGIAIIVAALLPGGAAAQSDPAHMARRAASMLNQAGLALQDARKARARVAALTQTVLAFEEGLAAMRDGLRQVSIREQALLADLNARREDVALLLGALLSLQSDPETTVLLHPAGPLATVQAGLLLGDVAPALQQEADVLAEALSEITLLRELQQTALQTLADGLDGVQSARTELSTAISERTDLPTAFASDPQKLAQLLQAADTLEAFATGLVAQQPAGQAAGPKQFSQRAGALALPAQGTVLRGFGDADAAGVRRPGLLLATRPLALVTTPAAATVRYRGPLLDYGNVIILEPANGVLLVLAGLAYLYAEDGQVIAEGEPVGLMGGGQPDTQAILNAAMQGAAGSRPQTLYIEVRQNGAPVDPAPWFEATKDKSE